MNHIKSSNAKINPDQINQNIIITVCKKQVCNQTKPNLTRQNIKRKKWSKSEIMSLSPKDIIADQCESI